MKCIIVFKSLSIIDCYKNVISLIQVEIIYLSIIYGVLISVCYPSVSLLLMIILQYNNISIFSLCGGWKKGYIRSNILLARLYYCLIHLAFLFNLIIVQSYYQKST